MFKKIFFIFYFIAKKKTKQQHEAVPRMELFSPLSPKKYHWLCHFVDDDGDDDDDDDGGDEIRIFLGLFKILSVRPPNQKSL